MQSTNHQAAEFLRPKVLSDCSLTNPAKELPKIMTLLIRQLILPRADRALHAQRRPKISWIGRKCRMSVNGTQID
jgi:hypothetical protein